MQGHRQLLAVLLPAGMRCLPDLDNSTVMANGDCIDIEVAQQGALIGPAFAGPFVLGGIPLAQLSDRFRRTTVLTVSLVCWSTAVLCQAFTTDVSVLLVLRMLLGAFEAGCNPSAYAILMAYWGASTRSGFAFGGYSLGVYIGFGLAYCSAGLSGPGNWRQVWMFAGIAGYCVAGLTLLIKEPPRAAKPKKEVIAATGTGLSQQPADDTTHWFRKLMGSRKYVLIVAAASSTFFARFALLGWLATFYRLEHNLPASEFGPKVGGIIMTAGAISAFSGGAVSDRFKTVSSRVNICTLSQLVPMPFWIGVLLAPSPDLSFALIFFAMITGDMYMGVSAATLQRIIDPTMAARGNQIYLASATLFGSCGPLLVGVAVQNGMDLKQILVIMCAIFFTLSGVLYNLLRIEMRDDTEIEDVPDFDNPAFGLDREGGSDGVSYTDAEMAARISKIARYREIKASAHAAVNEAYM